MNKIIWLLMICEGVFSYLICGSNPYDDYTGLSIILISINTIVMIIAVVKLEAEDRRIAFIILMSYLLRTCFMIFDIYGQSIFTLPNSGSDTEKFQINAVMYALYGDNANYEGREIATTEILFGLFYRFYGVQRMLMQHYNILLSMATIYNVLSVLRKFKVGKKAMCCGLLLICFLPNYMIISSLYLRESLIIYLISLSVICFARWVVDRQEVWIYLALAACLGGSMFHSGAIVLAGSYGLFLLFYDKESQKFRVTKKTLVFFLLGAVGIIILFDKFYNLFFLKLGNINSIQDITKRVSYGFGGGSDYVAPGANASTIGEFLLATPARMFYFIASPVPWLWRGLQDVFAFFFDALPFAIAFFAGFLPLIEKEDRKKKLFAIGIFFSFLLGIFMFAWGVNNAGTALRHRNKYISMEVLLISMGIDIVVNHIKRKRLS